MRIIVSAWHIFSGLRLQALANGIQDMISGCITTYNLFITAGGMIRLLINTLRVTVV